VNPVVVIPTYDEAAALPSLLERVLALDPPFDVLIVDDASPDGTGEIAETFARRTERVAVLHRASKRGLGTAYRDGFVLAISRGARVVIEMDADHSHNPKFLPSLVGAIEGGADVAIGSRYVNGVRVENWPFRRLLLSRFANYYVNRASGLPISVVTDATSGFRAYRSGVLEAIGLDSVASSGYFFQIEMAYRAWRLGFAVREVPITFEEHYLTSSKISGAIVWEAVWRTPLLRLAPRRASRS
jgi:glycosyltransferase involved in cell wall biosynthesis